MNLDMEIAGLILAVIAQAVGIAKWLDAKQERKQQEQRSYIDTALLEMKTDLAKCHADIARANERINGVKDAYCKKEDQEKDAGRLSDLIKESRSELSQSLRELQKSLTEIAVKIARDQKV